MAPVRHRARRRLLAGTGPLVAFALESAPDGVTLTITESGFDQIPLERRAKAFAANERGWGFVIRLIGDYLGLSQY
jgi:hypothetical protein